MRVPPGPVPDRTAAARQGLVDVLVLAGRGSRCSAACRTGSCAPCAAPTGHAGNAGTRANIRPPSPRCRRSRPPAAVLTVGARRASSMDGAPGPQRSAEGAARIDAVTARVRGEAPRAQLVLRQPQPGDPVHGLGNLGRRSSGRNPCAAGPPRPTSSAWRRDRARARACRASSPLLEQGVGDARGAGRRPSACARSSGSAAGESAPIICSRKPRRFQKIAKAWSNRPECSWVFTKTACSIARKSSRDVNGVTATASSASSTAPGPTGRPACAQGAGEIHDVVGELAGRESLLRT